jgi:hypothetical protein
LIEVFAKSIERLAEHASGRHVFFMFLSERGDPIHFYARLYSLRQEEKDYLR